MTISDRLKVVVQQDKGSAALVRAARLWLEVDHNFTTWIHDVAKTQFSDDELLALAEAEESHESEADRAWNAYAVVGNEVNESALIDALEAMVHFRNDSMGQGIKSPAR